MTSDEDGSEVGCDHRPASHARRRSVTASELDSYEAFPQGVVIKALGVRGAGMSCEIWARGSTRIRRNKAFLTKMLHARRTG